MNGTEAAVSYLGEFGLKSWVGQVFLVVFATLLLSYLLRLFIRRLREKVAEQTSTRWDDSFVDAIGPPAQTLVWIIGFAFAVSIVDTVTEAPIFDALVPVRDLGVIATVAWFLVRFIREARENFIRTKQAKNEPFDPATVDAVVQLLRMSVFITAGLVALQTLGYSISGILAFGGIGGIAVGFAARDLLANFFGGLMIYLDRPVAVGDWIRSPDREIEGTVEEIGWRRTVIRTFDSRPLYVPNSMFNSISLENPSRMANRRIYEYVGVRYDDAAQVEAIVRDVDALLRNHPDIDQEQTLMVNFDRFASSSLDFFVYCFTRTKRWAQYHAVKQDVLLKILGIVESHGAQVAFPTSTIHLLREPESMAPGQRRPEVAN